MLEYKIIEEGSLYDLEIKVNKALKEGWELVGAPSLSFQENTRGWYMQAMKISKTERPADDLSSIFGGENGRN